MSQQPTLRPVLGPLALTTLGIGSVIGTGIFVLTGTAAPRHILTVRKAGYRLALEPEQTPKTA